MDSITKAMTRPRCPICDWPMAESRERGCVPGDCSYRPDDPAEQRRVRERRESLKLSNCETTTIDSVPSCGQENDYRRAQTNGERK